MIPAGKYLATVASADTGTTKKGDPQVAITFTVDEGEQIGQRIASYRYFTDKALKYTLNDLRTCGWRGDDPFVLDGMVGTQVQIVVIHEEYEGKAQAKVKWINSLGSAGKPVEESQRDALRRRVKAAVNGEDSRPNPPPPDDAFEPPF